MLYPTYLRQNDPVALARSMLRDLVRGCRLVQSRAASPPVKIWQGQQTIAVTAERPGTEPGDVEIAFKANFPTLFGERRALQVREGARRHRNERGYGKFSRVIRLTSAASDDKGDAPMTSWVLRVVVARPEELKREKIRIKAAWQGLEK